VKTARFIIAITLLSRILLFASNVSAEEKIKVGSVTFSGNIAFSENRLSRLMLTKSSGFLSKSYYYEDILSEDIANLALFYQNNGYLEVKIENPIVSADSVKNEVTIKIIIDEGPLTRVEGISILSNEVINDSTMLQKIKLEQGDPFKRSRVQEGMIAIASLYADQGYLDAVVKPDIKISFESHLAVIDLEITENHQATISNIQITGLEKTKEYVLKRELNFKPGQVVSYSKLLSSQRRLYLTGLFESVFIRPIPSSINDPGQRTILVEVKEKLSGEMNIAVGYGSVDKVRGRFEILNNNLFGTGRQAGTSLSASLIRRAAEASFSEPWTFNLKLKTDVNLIYEYLKEPGYDMGRFAARFTIGRSIRKNSYVGLTYRFEEANLSNVEVSQIPATIDSRTRSLLLSIVYDTRDNLFNPKSGKYIELTNELAGAFLKGNNTFVRSIVKLKGFYSYNSQTIFASSFELGWMDYFGVSEDIPLNERFYAGGPNSIRGFGYQLVGPLEGENIPLGGRFKAVWNVVEIRRTIYKLIGAAVFLDAGNVWTGISDFHIKDLRLAAGPGLRANTPIGLMRFDLGVNLFPHGQESNTKLHFNVGHSF